MAQQHFPQARPFISKETFDQVSAVMWGQSALDYQISYIFPRTEWNDSDIREEALYLTGVLFGFRLAAQHKTSQPIRHQNGHRDQSSALNDGGGCQLGCTSQCDPRFGKHNCYTPHLPLGMAQPPPSQSSRPPIPFRSVARNPFEIHALQRQAAMELACRQRYLLPTATEVPGMQLPGGLKAVYRPGQGIVAVSGAPTSPDGRTVLLPLPNSAASQPRAEIPLHQKPQTLAAAYSDGTSRNATFTGQSGARLDEACVNPSIQSTERESTEPGGFETDNEDWVNL